jgi:integrase
VTGARPHEVIDAEWPQFDLQRGVWTKPSHHTKERKVEAPAVERGHFAHPAADVGRQSRTIPVYGPQFGTRTHHAAQRLASGLQGDSVRDRVQRHGQTRKALATLEADGAGVRFQTHVRIAPSFARDVACP